MSSSANNVFFDDEATLAMGAAFDRACSSLGRSARHDSARELIAKRIIEAETKKAALFQLLTLSGQKSATPRRSDFRA